MVFVQQHNTAEHAAPHFAELITCRITSHHAPVARRSSTRAVDRPPGGREGRQDARAGLSTKAQQQLRGCCWLLILGTTRATTRLSYAGEVVQGGTKQGWGLLRACQPAHASGRTCPWSLLNLRTTSTRHGTAHAHAHVGGRHIGTWQDARVQEPQGPTPTHMESKNGCYMHRPLRGPTC
jgi:hypothetical protein